MKIAPVASEVDAEPTVWEMFASRIVPRRPSTVKIATAITAAGIDADTVSPTRSPRYAFAAPNTTPSRTPMTTARAVNSSEEPREGSSALERTGGV